MEDSPLYILSFTGMVIENLVGNIGIFHPAQILRNPLRWTGIDDNDMLHPLAFQFRCAHKGQRILVQIKEVPRHRMDQVTFDWNMVGEEVSGQDYGPNGVQIHICMTDDDIHVCWNDCKPGSRKIKEKRN